MKFLPENRKKTVWLTVILVLAIAGVVYIQTRIVFPPAPAPVLPAPAASTGQANPSQKPAAGLAPIAGTNLLPYGSQINDQILRGDKFKVLRPGSQLNVSPSELGKLDLFAP